MGLGAMDSNWLGLLRAFVQNTVLETLEKEAECQLQLSVLSRKACGSSDEADVQGVGGEGTTGYSCASVSPSVKWGRGARAGEELLGSPCGSEGLC